MEKNKLPPIPLNEWLILTMGIIIFGATEGILFLAGYTNLLYNTIAAFILASVINFGIFSVKSKIKRIMKAVNLFIAIIISIPLLVTKAVASILRLIGSLIKGIIKAITAIPSFIKWCIKVLPTLAFWFGIVLLNLAMIPVLAVYLTIYGVILSLSGGANKIMLKHYDAFGHKMLAPFKKYMYYEAITIFVMFGIIVAVGSQILNAYSTASSITSATITANVTAYNNVALGTTAAYFPVILIVVLIVAIILILRSFIQGAGSFAL